MISDWQRLLINMQKNGETFAGIVDYHVKGGTEDEGLQGTCKKRKDNLAEIAFLRGCRLSVIA